MLKAVILDYQSLAPQDLDWTAIHALPIEWTFYDTSTAQQALERVQGMDLVLSNKVVLDKALLQANPQIKLIIVLATGTNNVDLHAAKQLGVAVSNIVAYSTESVVQHTFACLLQLTNYLTTYSHAAVNGLWSQSQSFTYLAQPIHELHGKTIGIIGYGAIGQRVAQIAQAFGMRVVIAQSLRGQVDQNRLPLTEVLQQSDVISIHTPLTEQTQNLIDAEQFALMKPNAILLNMARGGIVNEQALLNALQNKIIAAAATDVLSQEPPQADHPLLHYQGENLLITPHIAWASQEARQDLLRQVVAIIEAFQQGQCLNSVIPA